MGDSLEASEGVTTAGSEVQNVAVVDFASFANYLRKASTILLPEDDDSHPEPPPALNAALDDKSNQECIRKFICDPQISTLFVQRSSSKGFAFFWAVFFILLKLPA